MNVLLSGSSQDGCNKGGAAVKEFCIGVLGGMGTYATLHMFEQYAAVFPAKKEWDRPRIIIDNRCTMPSRVRALLYNEDTKKLVKEMGESLDALDRAGATRIILACNTSHLFLPEIYKTYPAAEKKIIHIINNCVKRISDDNVKTVYLLASEGTIDSQIYQKKLYDIGIECLVPENSEYGALRKCIEAVKQNEYSDDVKRTFLGLVNRHETVLLGCTELPILCKKYIDDIKCKQIYDPAFLALAKLKEEYDNA